MSLTDRRDEMSLSELIEECELRFPEKLARMEARYGEVMEDPDYAEGEEAEELADELRSLLRI